jgi:two-component system sensor histidine kinase BaeS
MNRSLTLKLILAFLVVSLVGTALVAVLAVWRTNAQFSRFVADQLQDDLVDQLALYYESAGDWRGVSEAFPNAGRGPGSGRRPGGPGPPNQGIPILLLDDAGRVVIPGLGYERGDVVAPAEWARGAPIEVDGQEVGRLLVATDTVRRGLAGAELLFLTRVNRAVIFASLGATVVALLLAVLLAQTLTRPLRELTAATRAVAKGDLAQKVPVRSEDELGQLAASFNLMNTELAHAQDLRHQMTADIAHELGTPLSLILGHSEALSEGVLPPETETFHVIHDEARRLSGLVDDLRTLSLAEARELPLTRRPTSPMALLERTVAAHAPRSKRRNISLQLDAAEGLPDVNVDPDRMAQVLDNLLGNAFRYTPAGGEIRLSASSGPSGVRLAVQDSGPGIPAVELPYVFERFYRGDKSRQRHEGGSGLGLAIARSIVEAHDGRIWAESEPGQGATFIIELQST